MSTPIHLRAQLSGSFTDSLMVGAKCFDLLMVLQTAVCACILSQGPREAIPSWRKWPLPLHHVKGLREERHFGEKE